MNSWKNTIFPSLLAHPLVMLVTLRMVSLPKAVSTSSINVVLSHPNVFNMMLQILEDVRLTDSKGRIVDFKNTLLIMTSNVGSSVIEKLG